MIPDRDEAKKVGLLVSARSIDEAALVLQSGVGWLDLKDPSRGPLGRPDTELVTRVRDRCDEHNHGSNARVRFSVAGGELSEWSNVWGTELIAQLRGDAYLKIASAGTDMGADWRGQLSQISEQLKNRTQLILVHYADWRRCNGPDWTTILELSRHLGCCYTLIDTFEKRSGRLVDHYSVETLAVMLTHAHSIGIRVALAGSIPLEHLRALSQLDASWIGVRGAVCEAGGRGNTISGDRLRAAVEEVAMGNLLRSDLRSDPRSNPGACTADVPNESIHQ